MIDKSKLAQYIIDYLEDECGSELWLGDDKSYNYIVKETEKAINKFYEEEQIKSDFITT